MQPVFHREDGGAIGIERGRRGDEGDDGAAPVGEVERLVVGVSRRPLD